MRHLVTGLVFALTLVGCAPDPLPGYRAASPGERAALVGVVREYYDLLDRAQVTGDIAPLFALHPTLAQAQGRQRGVNTEAWLVERTRALNVREVTVDLDSYEPMKTLVKEDHAVVYVHGLFTWVYHVGSETKGELPVRFDLVRDGERWTIVQTDEQVLGETPPPTPR